LKILAACCCWSHLNILALIVPSTRRIVEHDYDTKLAHLHLN
jgi:hypothetical protein